ncbi:MAG TPA: hypothetical protein VIX89_12965 [Bryobacteraceae bacterium]
MVRSSLARRWLPPVLPVAILLLFLVANRGAYKGYFDSDDFNNLNFTRHIDVSEFAGDLFSPRVFSNNFRPAGHLFYHSMYGAAGLKFVPYIAAIHCLHLANVLFLWLVLRKLGFDSVASFAGTLFFAFEMAVFDAYWKPMYVFDLLCAAFCLLSLLAYLHDWLIPSVLAFLLAFRAKEVAVMLPVVLALYEFLLHKKRWKRLIPFFVIALAFGIQALLLNQARNNDYSLRFSPLGIWNCIVFYASKLFLVPYAGFAVLALPFLARDRRVRFGVAAFCILLLPMLLLPGRLYGVYLYVPLIGLAIALAALTAGRMVIVAALFFAIWIPWNYANLRWNRRAELAAADGRRMYVAELAKVVRQYPSMPSFYLIRAPLGDDGVRDAIQLLRGGAQPVVRDAEAFNAREALNARSLAVLEWDTRLHTLHTRARLPDTEDSSYIAMDPDTPVWQLADGWQARVAGFRWTAPSATARLRRPANASGFELTANISPLYIGTVKVSRVEVFLNGTSIGVREFTRAGWQTVHWDLAGESAGSVEVKFNTSPAFPADPPLGLAIGGFGFAP